MTTDLEKRQKQEIKSTAAEQMSHSGEAFSPDVDIYASQDALVFAVDLPGVNKGDVKIQIDENNTLIIQAINTQKEAKGNVLRQYRVGDYYRAFQITDDYDKDQVVAKLENGFLEVTVPRKESAKPRKIEIQA